MSCGQKTIFLVKWNGAKSAFDSCVKLKNRCGLKQNNTPDKPAIIVLKEIENDQRNGTFGNNFRSS